MSAVQVIESALTSCLMAKEVLLSTRDITAIRSYRIPQGDLSKRFHSKRFFWL